ncbi:HAD family hydrolase [Nonomuraea sp. NPDC050536]|uniref:HAD family hydrolase n=1 Tax=Nonomuraea sp. NPDC050536 TaxID=3364366 RepID=UPI0037CB5B73
MTALHVMDMDGTLLHGTTASIRLSRALACEHEVLALEEAFAAGRVTTREFAARLHQLWAELTEQIVAETFAAGPWLDGIADVVADIHSRGEHAAVITMSPGFYADHLCELGFDYVAGSRFPPLPMRQPLDLAGILAPHDKVPITRRLLAQYRVPSGRWVAYGDSLSDQQLFAQAPISVAVNAIPALAASATCAYTGASLIDAYMLARDHLDRPNPRTLDPSRR